MKTATQLKKGTSRVPAKEKIRASKKISVESLSICILGPSSVRFKGWNRKPSRILVRALSHPRILSASLIGVLLILSFMAPFALPIALTLITLRTFAAQKQKSLPRGLIVQLHPPAQWLRAGETGSLRIEIVNQSAWTLHTASFHMFFPASLKSLIEGGLNEPLAPNKTRFINLKFPCDAGIGEFDLGAFTLHCEDFFRMFPVEIEFRFEGTFTVYPQIRVINEISSSPTWFSDLFGNKEIPQRGNHINFAGVRPYSQGDSIRHIAWRASAKFGDPIVKEFEKFVHSDITLVVNLNPQLQVGSLKVSTWETLKQLSLSLASQFLSQQNSVRFATNSNYFEKGYGKDQLHRIVDSILRYNIYRLIESEETLISESMRNKRRVTPSAFVENPLSEWSHLIPSDSNLFYLSPIHYNHLTFLSPLLRRLRARGVNISLFLVSPDAIIWRNHSFMKALNKGPSFHVEDSRNKMSQLLAEFQRIGISIYKLEIDCDWKEGLKELPHRVAGAKLTGADANHFSEKRGRSTHA